MPLPAPACRPAGRGKPRGGIAGGGPMQAHGERACGLLLGLLHDGRFDGDVRGLGTGAEPRAQAHALADGWHIHTPGEARGTLAWLLEEGHRALYPQVCRILFTAPRAAREREIVLLDQFFDPVRLARCIDNLERALPGLRADGFVASGEDLARGVLAWDMSRAVHVARMAYDCGMQSEVQAWAVIERAAAQVFAQFASWEHVMHSYLLGRAMWGGPDGGLTHHMSFARACIDDPASPWRATPYPGRIAM
ncbi:DUF1266 domain-containing protein [Cupriavidus sp. 2TAF22]|uniref:DUF1266 domain-containing protein n=1 Tax=unclassified Cupriavidus TaxID=2640874 RepID=UPI003F91BDA8